MSSSPTPLTSRNWFGKASAGLILGLAIGVGFSGLFAYAFGAIGPSFALPGQFIMWLVGPVWALILSFCFLFRSGLRAWTILGAVTLAIWLVLFLLGRL